jgi:hypothetical protein
MLIQVCLSICSTIVPSWCSLALMPFGDVAEGEPSFQAPTPGLTELAFQKVSADSLGALEQLAAVPTAW